MNPRLLILILVASALLPSAFAQDSNKSKSKVVLKSIDEFRIKAPLATQSRPNPGNNNI